MVHQPPCFNIGQLSPVRATAFKEEGPDRICDVTLFGRLGCFVEVVDDPSFAFELVPTIPCCGTYPSKMHDGQ